MYGGILLKIVSSVGFFERKKQVFLESVSYHREMLCATNFGLVICICIVNAMILIKKNIGKLVQDQLLQNVKDHQYDKF